MNRIDAALRRLRAIADQFPVEQRPTFAPGASAESIAGLEAVLPAALPEDFAHFARACDAVIAMAVWNGYWVGGVDQLTRSVTRGDFPSSVPDDAGSAAAMPVATDGGGNAFLLGLRDGRVWKWNHASDGVRAAGACFAEFLERVADDWEHFLRGDDSWAYLSG